MPQKGCKYICGGREFWCIHVDAEKEVATVCSGPAVLPVPFDGFEKQFKQIGSWEVGEQHMAKSSYGDVHAGIMYKVTAVTANSLELDGTVNMPITTFGMIF